MNATNGKSRATGRSIRPKVIVERIPEPKDDGCVTSIHPWVRDRLLLFRVPRFRGCPGRIGMTGFYSQATGKLRVERQTLEQWRAAVIQFEQAGGERFKELQVRLKKLDIMRALKAT